MLAPCNDNRTQIKINDSLSSHNPLRSTPYLSFPSSPDHAHFPKLFPFTFADALQKNHSHHISSPPYGVPSPLSPRTIDLAVQSRPGKGLHQGDGDGDNVVQWSPPETKRMWAMVSAWLVTAGVFLGHGQQGRDRKKGQTKRKNKDETQKQ